MKYNDDLSNSGKGVYRIVVEGHLESRHMERLKPMSLISNDIKEGPTSLSTIEGSVEDQSALVGLIEALYEWNYPIVSVSRLD